MVQNFCTRKNLGAKKVEAKDSEMEKLEIKILTQNFEIKKFKRKKTLKIKIINIKVRKEGGPLAPPPCAGSAVDRKNSIGVHLHGFGGGSDRGEKLV